MARVRIVAYVQPIIDLAPVVYALCNGRPRGPSVDTADHDKNGWTFRDVNLTRRSKSVFVELMQSKRTFPDARSEIAQLDLESGTCGLLSGKVSFGKVWNRLAMVANVPVCP